MNGLYLYCILDGEAAKRAAPASGVIDGCPVELLSRGDLSLALSPVESFELDVASETLLRRLAAHQRVIEHFLEAGTVLPVKFGSVLPCTDEAAGMLEQSQRELSEALGRFANTIELDLVVTWADLKEVFGELAAQPEIEKLRADALCLEPARRQEAVVQVGQRVKELLDEKVGKLAGSLLDALAPHARDTGENELRDDSMLLNAAFLLERGDQGRFMETVETLSAHYEGELDFRVVGPLPPYSFATIRVRRPDATALLGALDLLELPPVASLQQVRTAHRRLGRALHPDQNPGCAEARQRFEAVNRAYALLEEHFLHLPHRFDDQSSGLTPSAEVKRVSELRAEQRL
jgi:hypothetical protein